MIRGNSFAAVLLCLLFPVSAIAANHYILDGGSGDGSAWNNALDALPSSLVRGDTYYVGDGSYVAYTVDDAVSGTDVITIKKATASDHGTETGWNASYGDGQAIFNYGLQGSAITIVTNYVVWDGSVSGGSDESGYGFKLNFPSDCWGADPEISLMQYTPVSGTRTGTSTGISATVVTDSEQNWPTSGLTGKFIGLTQGEVYEWYQIYSSTATSITITGSHDLTADGFSAGATYELRSLTGSNTVLMYAGTTTGNDFTDITVKNTSFDGSACGYDYRAVNNIGIKSTAYTAKYISNLIIDSNYFGDTNTNLHGTKWEGAVVSNNYFASNYSGQGYEVHGQQISPAGNDMAIHGNIFKDSTIAAILVHGAENDAGKIYNNIFIQSSGHESDSNGLIQANYAEADNMLNWEIHHNTVIGLNGTSYGFLVVGNVTSEENYTTAYNNLFYNCAKATMDNVGFTAGAIIHDYNGYIDVTTSTAEDNDVIGTGDPFVDSAGSDYRLHLTNGSALISAGYSGVGAAFSLDRNGTTRPQGAGWDIGAHEYTGFHSLTTGGSSSITIGGGAHSIAW